MTRPRPVVTLAWAKYRGPGKVTFDSDKPKVDVISGGKQDEPFAGKASATAKFSEPGTYELRAIAPSGGDRTLVYGLVYAPYDEDVFLRESAKF